MAELLLGDNPLFGVSHRSGEAVSSKAGEFEDLGRLTEILRCAKRHGACGWMLSSHERAGTMLAAMLKDRELSRFPVAANIPYIMKYVSRSTKVGLPALLLSVMSGAAGFLTKDFKALVGRAIDMELKPYRKAVLHSVFLHNGITDLALGLGIDEALLYFDAHIRKKYSVTPGFGTLNPVALVGRLERCGLKSPLVMAPFNERGFYMNPSQRECEELVRGKRFRLLAMNTLAQGAIPPERAFAYLKRFGVERAVIGASTEAHIASSFAEAGKL